MSVPDGAERAKWELGCPRPRPCSTHLTLTITLALCLGAQPVPPPSVQFDRITLEDAKRLEGTELQIVFTPDRWATTILIDGVPHTHAGSEEFDEHGRTVILRGDRTAKLRASP